jgi:1-pyrroline-4-hydroxy-2-carboxylate deaminase
MSATSSDWRGVFPAVMTQFKPEEKRDVMLAAVKTAAGRLPVLSGVAEYTTDQALAQCRRAAEAGCEG